MTFSIISAGNVNLHKSNYASTETRHFNNKCHIPKRNLMKINIEVQGNIAFYAPCSKITCSR